MIVRIIRNCFIPAIFFVSTFASAQENCGPSKICFVEKRNYTYTQEVQILISNLDGSNARIIRGMRVEAYPSFDAAGDAAVVAAKVLEANGTCTYIPGWY